MSVVGLVESYTTMRESSSVSAVRKYIESHKTLSMSVVGSGMRENSNTTVVKIVESYTMLPPITTHVTHHLMLPLK